MDLLHQLKDIKPNVEIVDYSFYVFIIFTTIILIALIIFAFKFFRKKENPNLLALKNLDFSNSKKTAYEFTRLAKEFINEKNKQLYEELTKELEKYKYKKYVDDLSPELIEKIKEFIKGIKWVLNILCFW